MSFARRASEQRAAEAQRLRLQAEVAALQQDLQGTRMALRDSEAREASLQQALERCVLGEACVCSPLVDRCHVVVGLGRLQAEGSDKRKHIARLSDEAAALRDALAAARREIDQEQERGRKLANERGAAFAARDAALAEVHVSRGTPVVLGHWLTPRALFNSWRN